MRARARAARERLVQTRLAFFDWVAGFDPRIVEMGCAMRGILNSQAVVTPSRGGYSAAPFLESTLFQFDSAASVLWLSLAVISWLQLFALAAGTYGRRWGREKYLLRIYLSGFAAFLGCTLVLGMLTTQQPRIVAAQYSISVLLNLSSLFVLWVRREQREDDDEHQRSRDAAATD